MIYGVPEALLLRTPEIAGQFLSIFNPKNQKGFLFEQEIFDFFESAIYKGRKYPPF